MVICSYDDYKVIEENGKLYFIDEDGKRELELILSIPIGEQTDEELMDYCGCDVSGELDNERVYCYWNFKRKSKVGYKQGICPGCGKAIEFVPNNWSWDGDMLYYYYTCDCGAYGTENYRVSFDSVEALYD